MSGETLKSFAEIRRDILEYQYAILQAIEEHLDDFPGVQIYAHHVEPTKGSESVRSLRHASPGETTSLRWTYTVNFKNPNEPIGCPVATSQVSFNVQPPLKLTMRDAALEQLGRKVTEDLGMYRD